MSETFDTSITAYAEPMQAEVARAAGVSSGAVANAAALLAVGALALLRNVAASAATGAIATNAAQASNEAARQQATSLVALRASLEALENRPELSLIRAVAHRHCGSALAAASQAVKAAEDKRASAPPRVADDAVAQATSSAQRALDGALRSAAGHLLAGERTALMNATQRALADAGLTVRDTVTRANGTIALRARGERGTSALVEVDAANRHLMVDLSGFSGTTCERKRDEILGALKKHGIHLRLAQRHLHARLKGGALTQQLAPLFPTSAITPPQDAAVRSVTRLHGRA